MSKEINRDIGVGDYVRTKNGLIGKVNYIELAGKGTRYAGEFISDTIIQFNDSRFYERRVRKEDITKYSKNIIDLIEEGDIIEFNGEKYQVIYDENYDKLGILIPNKDYLAVRHTSLEFIFQQNKELTILTKEQYMQNCYTVEREEKC